jgi:hypothetical protein
VPDFSLLSLVFSLNRESSSFLALQAIYVQLWLSFSKFIWNGSKGYEKANGKQSSEIIKGIL